MVSCRLIAYHYPRPEHHGEMVERVGRAAEVMASVPGCLEAGCWIDEVNGAVVAMGDFATRAGALSALAAVGAANVDFDFDEREHRPRDVYTYLEQSRYVAEPRSA
jgi:hypothetical protein